MKEAEIFEAIVNGRSIDVDSFINPRYEDLLDPLTLDDIEPAVKRLRDARKNKELVAVYGDYDIDGLSATALLCDAFESFAINCIGFIPDRFIDGYGMSKNGIDSLEEQGVKLIVTVDCGSKSEAEIAYAKKKGIDVIVTDHHEIDEIPQSAIAVINAKRKDSKYGYRERCGAGIAFALVQAMQASGIDGLDKGQEKWLLDLVALATVADIVELQGENRILLKWGLEVLKKTRRVGIKELMTAASVTADSINTSSIGFRLGPRLNAAGRIEHGQLALSLLMETDAEKAKATAEKLEALNTERRAKQDTVIREALNDANELEDSVLVLHNPKWPQGVVGIAASKIVESTLKPSFILQDLDDGTTKGSARSFGDFDLSKALKKIKTHLISGGGHNYAAGITIKTSEIEEVRVKLNKYYESLKLTNQDEHFKHQPEIVLDNFTGLSLQLVDLLEQLAPFGPGNPELVFEVKNVHIAEFRGVGQEQKHAKIKLQDLNGNTINGIGFSLSHAVSKLQDQDVNIIGKLSRNEFNSYVSAQFELLELKPS